jgi:biofilm protein TabA
MPIVNNERYDVQETGSIDMILDTTSHSDMYQGLHPNIDKGLEFLRWAASESLSEGRHEIDGDTVYAMVQTYETAEASTKRFEAHRRYVDIQYIHSGAEAMYWQQIDRLPPDGQYDPETDCRFYGDAESTELWIKSGDLVILLPHDAHKPGCKAKGPELVRKIVIKCRIRG